MTSPATARAAISAKTTAAVIHKICVHMLINPSAREAYRVPRFSRRGQAGGGYLRGKEVALPPAFGWFVTSAAAVCQRTPPAY
jgi:hypothetical protein